MNSAESAVDELVRLGVADDRVAVGGHSYGAFMTANLLAHSRRFKAGIGRSGAYNRLLTPFGFQSEERTLWEAPDTYVTVMPYSRARLLSRLFFSHEKSRLLEMPMLTHPVVLTWEAWFVDVAFHARRQGGGASPPPSRRERRQPRDLPSPGIPTLM